MSGQDFPGQFGPRSGWCWWSCCAVSLLPWAGKGRWLCPRAVGSASAALDLWRHKSLPFPVLLMLMSLCSQKDSEDNLSKSCWSNRVSGSSAAQGTVSEMVIDANYR